MAEATMIERVARAIAFNDGARMIGAGQSNATREFGWKGDGEHLDKYAEAHWKEHVGAARMAIEAMRKPTPHMVNVGWQLILGNLRPDEIFPHMIDAALTEKL